MATNIQMQQSASILRRALQGNALFSAASGLISLLAARPLANLMGIPWPIALVILGMLLLGYALALFMAAKQDTMAVKIGPAAVAMDSLWVIGTVILLLGSWLPLTTAGFWILLIIGDIVFLFVGWQAYGLRRHYQQTPS